VILYSIIPADVVFGNYFGKNADEYSLKEILYEGEKVEVIPMSNNTYKVNRIISTEPKAYLNPKLMPGSVIESLK